MVLDLADLGIVHASDGVLAKPCLLGEGLLPTLTSGVCHRGLEGDHGEVRTTGDRRESIELRELRL